MHKYNQLFVIRYWLLVGIFLFFSGIVFAQKDAKAKEILDKSSAAFASAGDISAYFTMNIKDTSNKQSTAFDGSIELKADQFHIDMPDNEIWFNGKTQWVLQKGWEEVNISEPTGQEVQMLNPGTIFTLYKEGSKNKYLGEKTDTKMRKVHVIELIPKNKKGEITKIILQINAADLMPVMFYVYFANKIENIIYINKYQTKLKLSDNVFIFDAKKYPNAEIIDLRN
jgi:outer membrane lipoprotein-sorting protein